MEIVTVTEKKEECLPQEMPQRERSLLLASVGTNLSVIREAQAENRPSRLLAPTMKIHRKTPQELHGSAFHPDGQTVMGGGSDGILEVYQVYGNCDPVATIRASRSTIRACGYMPNGSEAYAAADDGSLSLWDLNTGDIVRRFGSSLPEGRYHDCPIMDAKVSKDGNLFLSADKRGTMLIWDMRTKTSVQRLNLGRTGQITPMLCAEWGRADKMAFVGTERGSVILYDLRRGSGQGPIEEFGRPHEIDEAFDNETSVQLGLELKRTLKSDGSMGLAQTLKRGGKRGSNPEFPQANIAGKGRLHESLRIAGNPRVTGLSVSPNGDFMATFSSDNKVRVYRTDYICKQDRFVCELPAGPVHNFENPNLKMKWHPNGKYLAVGSANRKVYVYSNMDRLYLSGGADPIQTGPYSNGKKDLAEELLAQTSRPALAYVLDGHISSVTDVSWHPTENILGSVGTDGQIILGELEL